VGAGLSRYSLWGVGAIPCCFLVLIFINLVFFVRGFAHGFKQSRLPIDLASSQFQPKHFARHFGLSTGYIHVIQTRMYAEGQSKGAKIGTATRAVKFSLR